MTAKIRIVMKSPGNQLLGNNLGRCTRKIGSPEERVLYTVLRSPHIDKKSREQSEMEIHKQLLVTETETHELRKKLFRSKRQRLFGAQYEIIFYHKTRSDRGKPLLRSRDLWME
uniref:Ribosomal protein S10 n=2 Tax=Pinaceae TaxID=3318 RepID=A0A8F4MHG8_ABIFI|nr:ribosomal protein S10 [Abies firma]QXE43741.1 ribosomal protein S10 [Cedrus deodara]